MPEERRYRRDRQRNKDKEKKNQDDGKKIILAKKEPSTTVTPNSSNSQPKLLLKPKEPARDERSSSQTPATTDEQPKDSDSTSFTAQPSENPLMKEPSKLLSSEFVFNCESVLPFIQEQSNDFLVVAFVGPQNVGKSTLANLMINSDNFKIRSKQDIAQFSPITKGIDVFITKERVILLDCGPLLSNISYKDYILSELDDIKTLTVLLSVCNLVVLVQEKYVNPNVVRMIHLAEMMRMKSNSSTDEENQAKLMFVENKTKKEDLTEKHLMEMKKVYKTAFSSSKFNHFLQESNKPEEKKTVENVNFMAIPDLKGSNKDAIERQVENFRMQVLMSKRYTTKYSQATQFSEKAWLQSLTKAWETQANNYFFKKYGNLKEKFNLLNHVSINDGLKYDKNVYYPDD